MKSLLSLMCLLLFATFVFTSCVVSPGPGGYGIDVAPPLPTVIELGVEPYYFHSGYHYYYQDNRWLYSRERNGTRMELPRSHWPNEVRYKGRGGESGHEHERK